MTTRTSDSDAPSFPLEHPVCQVLFQGKQAKMAAGRSRVDRPIEVYRGIESSALPFQKVKAAVSELANSHPDLQENVDEFGRCFGTAVRSNWNGVRHINGFPMRNGTWPLASNLEKRADAGLKNDWVAPWHQVVFKAFVRCFFKDLHPVDLKLRKGSSTVVPFFSKDPGVRKDLARRALAEARVAGELWLKGDYTEAYLAHQFGGAYYVVYRSQSTDKISFDKGVYTAKPRMVADKEYALSGGKRGRLFESSKSLDDVDFRVLPGFFRERLRTAMGGPYQLNVALMPIMQAVRKRIYSEYGFSFHHTTRAQKEAKVRAWDTAVMVDVSDHDTFWPTHLYLPLIKEALADLGYADWWIALMEGSFRLPIYVGAPAVDEGKTLIGDWRKPDLQVGMPSGQSGTDVFGTLGMSFLYFIVQVTHTAPRYITELQTLDRAERVVDAYLRGKLEFAAMSKTDDAVLLWGEGVIAREAIKLRQDLKDEKPVCDYMHISYEHGGAFLGDILLYDASRRLKQSVFVGNILSMANNSLSPEYGVQSAIKDRSRVRRPFPGLAYESYKDVYGSAPGYGPLLEVLEKAWRPNYHESYEAFRRRQYEEDLVRLSQYLASVAKYSGLDHLSMADKEVLVSPDKLDYKYDPDMINSEVVDLTVYKIPVAEISDYFFSVTGGSK